MRKIFADTSYWIAIFFPRDQWHEKAKALSKSLSSYRLFITDEVLTEFLTFLAPMDLSGDKKQVNLLVKF